MKKGISLIVLVITIIVMIIIAGAIILSLNSSNVTQRANESTLASDRANYQAAYATKLAELTTAADPTPTVTGDMLNFKDNTYGTWSLVDGEVKFTVKADDAGNAKFIKAYGDITGSYAWIVAN